MLTPDLARGLMLLLIVMSNTAFHLWTADHGGTHWHPIDGSTADRVVQFCMITMLDLRIYPLFAFLFGYGIMLVYQRHVAAGSSERGAVRLLRRRSLWLIVFGFVHAALFLAGDIVSYYGALSLVLGWILLRRRDRTLLIWCAGTVVLAVATSAPVLWAIATGDLGSMGSVGVDDTAAAYAAGEHNLLAAAGTRLQTWAFLVVVGGTAGVISTEVALGFWAARKRILEEPHKHLPLLRWTAAIGITLGWLGGLPAALAHVGILDVPSVAMSETGALRGLQQLTGVFGGVGYVALLALLVHRMSDRTRRRAPVVAVAALGKRSLSGYLTHSAIFAPLLAAWGLGLGAHLGSATMALFAIGVWLVTVLAAYALERSGRPGPAEALLRRLVYRRTPVSGQPAMEPSGTRPG